MLCKIYRKATSLKVLEQRAVEEETRNLQMNATAALMAEDQEQAGEEDSFCSQIPRLNSEDVVMKKENSYGEEDEEEEVNSKAAAKAVAVVSGGSSSTSLQIPKGFEMLTDLQVPKATMDWTQDQFWNQFNSPWFLNLITTPSNILNF